MTTKTIFNMDISLKTAAMKKARAEGLTLSAVLNLILKAFVKNELQIGAFEKSIIIAKEDIKRGRVISQEDLFKKLGI
ncbi:MAG: hypothetical protein AAB484_02405 [Patescibacteria group bacterium]